MEESRYEQETAEVEIPSDVGLKGVAVSPPVEAKGLDEKPELSLRDDELQRIGGEVFFKRDNNPKCTLHVFVCIFVVYWSDPREKRCSVLLLTYFVFFFRSWMG